MDEQAAGVATTSNFIRPKGVEVFEVNNGFTVSLKGGEGDKSPPFGHNLHIAYTVDEVISLVKGHLEKN